MIASKNVPAEVLAELANEFAAGLPARAAVIREALGDLELGASADAAMRVRLTAHSLAGTASAFGATELVPHAEVLESLGKQWHQNDGAATDADLARANSALEQLTASIGMVADRLRSR